MKLSAAALRSLLGSAESAYSNFLLFGPDTGQVRELAHDLTGKFTAQSDDPFAVSRLSGQEIKADPARLHDAAFSLALTGGECVVVVGEAGDFLVAALEEVFAAASKPWPIIVEAGELAPRSKLRKLFENRDDAAAIGCYGEEGKDLERLIAEICREHGLAVAPDALAFLAGNLGGDRLVVRRELEKLCLYVLGGPGRNGEVGYEDARDCIGDSRSSSLDAIVDAIGEGRKKSLGPLLDKAFSEGVNSVALVRAVQRHFQRLQLVQGLVANGMSPEQALGRLRPPVFFKRKESFRHQAGHWDGQRLQRAMGILSQCEIDCKSSGMPAELICNRALMRLAFAA